METTTNRLGRAADQDVPLHWRGRSISRKCRYCTVYESEGWISQQSTLSLHNGIKSWPDY